MNTRIRGRYRHGGLQDGKAFCDNYMIYAYDEIFHWKLLLPSGSARKSFVREITKLLQAFASGSTLEDTALKASFVMQILLLQKPSQKSKTRDHATHLERRLELWKQGDIPSLIHEGRCIQHYLISRPRPSDDDHCTEFWKDDGAFVLRWWTQIALVLLWLAASSLSINVLA